MRPHTIRSAHEIIPWKVIDLALRPFVDFYAFNPSIHYDSTDGQWRCIMRNCDYHAPGGNVVWTRRKGGRITTRNVMVTLDPETWRPIAHCEMRELDGLARNTAAGAQGFEDMRLFRTERDGLVAIATTMQLRFDSSKQDIVLCTLDSDDDYAIVEAKPIRGAWNEVAQKNWVPFDGALGARFLYSIERGLVFDDRGPVSEVARPTATARELAAATIADAAQAQYGRISHNGSVETRHTHRVVRADRAGDQPLGTMRNGSATPRAVGPGWISPGLRGGSQLVRVDDDRWLGIGHEMRVISNRKFYWHTWYTCDDRGRLLARSEPMKLSGCGIEFAAGLALDADDGDRLVCSFGTDDQDSWLGITSLEAVACAMRPVAPLEIVPTTTTRGVSP